MYNQQPKYLLHHNHHQQLTLQQTKASPFRLAISDFQTSPRLNSYRSTNYTPVGQRNGMQQIFQEAKQKIKLLKEESNRLVKPQMIQSYRKISSRNAPMINDNKYQKPVYQTAYDTNKRRVLRPPQYQQDKQLYSTTQLNSQRSSNYQSLKSTPRGISSSTFDKNEYEREVSQRRKEKIVSLKSQLIGMLQNQAVSKSEVIHQTPIKRFCDSATKNSSINEEGSNQKFSSSKINEHIRHSALKSRLVKQQAPLIIEKVPQFQLVNTVTSSQPQTPKGAFDNNLILQTVGTIKSICQQTESKFSLYSLSESEQSIQQHTPMVQKQGSSQQVVQIQNQLENEQSITFISSKFIKSNSMESIPDMQGPPQQNYYHVRQNSFKRESEYKALSSYGGLEQYQAFSDNSNPLSTNDILTIQPYKRRNQSNTARQTATNDPSQLNNSTIIFSNHTLSRSCERNVQVPHQLMDTFKKEDIQKLQNGIKGLKDDQIKQMPVLYIHELRRLARVINKVFGDGVY